jgi:formate hydrogenlyase subunit 6/NADH:ubiquinone oxidoreductase subunit I
MNQPHDRDAAHPIPFIAPERCTGCGLCVAICPTGALAMRDAVAVVAQPDVCAYTGHCELICPAQAITRPFQIISISQEKPPMNITKDTRVSAILEEYGDIAEVMEVFGVKRVGRYSLRALAASALTVEWAARLHRVPLDEFLEILQRAVQSKTQSD